MIIVASPFPCIIFPILFLVVVHVREYKIYKKNMARLEAIESVSSESYSSSNSYGSFEDSEMLSPRHPDGVTTPELGHGMMAFNPDETLEPRESINKSI